MGSAVEVRFQKPVIIEAPDPTHHRPPLATEGSEAHPFRSTAQTDGSEDAPPPYTDGPSRIILANDGKKPCLALLLTPDLVSALHQTAQAVRALERKTAALQRLESEILDWDRQAEKVRAAIRNPANEALAEEMQLALEIVQLESEEARECMGRIDIERVSCESRLRRSRGQAGGILERALLDARLLEHEPVPGGSTATSHDV